MVLNSSLPAVWQADTPLQVAQALAIYVPFTSGSHIRSLKANTTISMLANLYVDTNGTASFDQIAELLGTNAGNVEELSSVIGQTKNTSLNAELLQRTILWGDSKLPNLPNYPPEVGYLALGIIFICISIITTILRLYQRSRAPAGLQAVDYTLFMALGIAIAMQVLFGTFVETLVVEKTGAIWFITYDIFIRLQIVAATLNITYHACILFLKSSILVFYAQMSTRPYQLWIIYSILGLSVASNIIGFFTQIFQYRPVDYWNNEFNPNLWPPRDKVIFGVGIINLLTDVLIWVMPIPTILKLGQTWWTRTIAMAIIFSSAGACVFSILRVRLVWLGALALKTGQISDFQTTTFSMLEINLAIITYNIPAIRALYTTYMRRRREKGQHNSFHLERMGVEDASPDMRCTKSCSRTGSTLPLKELDLLGRKESPDAKHAEIV